MFSPIHRIYEFRKSPVLSFDRQNSNPYRVVCNEENGSQTAYCFSAPMYESKSKKALDMKFRKNGEEIHFAGSGADVTFADAVTMKNKQGFCRLSLPQRARFLSDQELLCGDGRIFGTTNGIAYKIPLTGEQSDSVFLEVDKPFMEVRTNNHCFALMREQFRPFVTVTCIGTVGTSGDVIAPAKVTYQKQNDRTYELSFKTGSPMGKWVLFEVNLYEPKLFQDTTVESNHPKMNNAFGSVCFLGQTKECGEQWLYTRPDFSKIKELYDKRILKAVLHIPKLNKEFIGATAYKLPSRFCSFGSTWQNKIAAMSAAAVATADADFMHLDLTNLLTDKHKRLSATEGFILKPQHPLKGFCVISTGDSYYAPQILEINFK